MHCIIKTNRQKARDDGVAPSVHPGSAALEEISSNFQYTSWGTFKGCTAQIGLGCQKAMRHVFSIVNMISVY